MTRKSLKKYREIFKGCLDYLLNRNDKNTYGGPFNNQLIRQEIFGELFRNFQFEEIIETGTYFGNTTEYLHKTYGVIVRTIEKNPRRYGFAKARLRKYPNIKTYPGSSDVTLKWLCEKPDIQQKRVFFYLDAHRDGRIPLLNELETIFANISQAVVMIDDFKVPDFPGYGFDTYPSGESLDLEYLSPLRHLGLKCFFPVADPKDETGKRRGSVVLTTNEHFSRKLQAFLTLKPYSNPCL